MPNHLINSCICELNEQNSKHSTKQCKYNLLNVRFYCYRDYRQHAITLLIRYDRILVSKRTFSKRPRLGPTLYPIFHLHDQLLFSIFEFGIFYYAE